MRESTLQWQFSSVDRRLLKAATSLLPFLSPVSGNSICKISTFLLVVEKSRAQ